MHYFTSKLKLVSDILWAVVDNEGRMIMKAGEKLHSSKQRSSKLTINTKNCYLERIVILKRYISSAVQESKLPCFRNVSRTQLNICDETFSRKELYVNYCCWLVSQESSIVDVLLALKYSSDCQYMQHIPLLVTLLHTSELAQWQICGIGVLLL